MQWCERAVEMLACYDELHRCKAIKIIECFITLFFAVIVLEASVFACGRTSPYRSLITRFFYFVFPMLSLAIIFGNTFYMTGFVINVQQWMEVHN